jgi:MFS family permease
MLAAGADTQSLSILIALVNFGLSLVSIKAPSILQRIGLSRKGAIILSFINFCAWVPLALVFLVIGVTPVWFALFWFVNLVPTLLLSVQRDNWLTNLVPRNILGRYLGQRLSIKSVFYLSAFCLFGYMLDSFGENRLIGFAFTFIIAFLAAALDFVIFTFMHDTANNAVEALKTKPEIVRFTIINYLKELREKRLKTFITFVSCIYLTVGLCGPLYAAYMMRELHFSYLSFTLIVCAEYLARIISLPYWGRYADRAGNIRVIGIAARIIPVIPVFWLFNSSLPYLAIIQVVSGTCWGAFDLCTNSYLYKMAPPSRKLHYITYTRALILISTVIGGLVSFYMMHNIFTIFGSTILSMFLISAVLRGIVVRLMFPKLIDLAVVYDKPQTAPVINRLMIDDAIASKRGLFYRQNTANLPHKDDKVIRNHNIPDFPPVTRAGLYHQASSTRPQTSQVTTGYVNKHSHKNTSGLYYRRDRWLNYKKNTLKEILKEKLGSGKAT